MSLFSYVIVSFNTNALIKKESFSETKISKADKNLNQKNIFTLKFEQTRSLILEILEETENDLLIIKKSHHFSLTKRIKRILISLSQCSFSSPLIELFIPPPNSKLV